MNATLQIPGIEEILERLERIEGKIDQREEPPPELMNVQEVAELLNVTDQTVRVYARNGSLPVANRVGRKMMFRREDVQSRRAASSSGDSA